MATYLVAQLAHNCMSTSASPTRKRRRWPRVLLYLFLGLLAVWFTAVQAGWMAMRTPDAAWPDKLQERGQQLSPHFYEIPDATGRDIHAIQISAADTLPLVLFVHGSPGSADAYLNYLADTALSKVLRLATMDRPGFGYTAGFGQPETSLAAQAQAVWAVAQELSPTHKVILVGHSLGGPIICRLAMDHPDAVAGLVLVAGSIDPDQEEHPWWQTAIDVLPLKWFTPKALWTSNHEIKPLENELRAILPFWATITCPVRVIHAQNDQLVPVENAVFARRQLTNSVDLQVKILPTGDHFILWNNQAVVREAILDLSRL